MTVVAVVSGVDVRGAVARLDAWLDTMRGPGGYAGPVVHWWQNSLFYTGVGLDWRYEGIIHGYLTLHERTGEGRWLAKARRAGDDLLAGQLPSGQFVGSAFELNPYTGGTPHEAACDLGLLALAERLRREEQPDWRRYWEAAERNLREAQLGRLWDGSAGRLRDDPATPSFVPNKAATLVEALLALARSAPDGDDLVARYVVPILDQVIGHQVAGGPLRGGIWQNTYEGRRVEKLFPYYVARCVPALLGGYVVTGERRFRDGAVDAARFVLRQRDPDGGFPQVIYGDGSVNRHPRWVAGAADIVRCVALAAEHGVGAEPEPTLSWLLAAQSPAGAFPTGDGFARQAGGRRSAAPSFRDILPVVGWNDKAFRFLAGLVPTGSRLPEADSVPYQAVCSVGRGTAVWSETARQFEVRVTGDVAYRWEKGAAWASVAAPELAWK